MDSQKGLYMLLKQNDRIKSERRISGPSRRREKAMGFMWEGELEVTLKEGAKVKFYFWHHCHDDNGSDHWVPSESMLNTMWDPKFVPVGPDHNSELVDATWHTFYVGNHIYVSKIGTFSFTRSKEDIIKAIADGSWQKDDDLWRII